MCRAVFKTINLRGRFLLILKLIYYYLEIVLDKIKKKEISK